MSGTQLEDAGVTDKDEGDLVWVVLKVVRATMLTDKCVDGVFGSEEAAKKYAKECWDGLTNHSSYSPSWIVEGPFPNPFPTKPTSDAATAQLNAVVDAWEALQGGGQVSNRAVETWLAEHMAVAVNAVRDFLGRPKPVRR